MLKVAVIDNNAISRNLLTTVLANGGYDVVNVGNASAAELAATIRLRPQIVCIDIGQADDAGFEKLDMLRRELPKALVFFVSGKIDSSVVQSALEHGVLGFIVKPFNATTVLTTIRNAIIKVARHHQARSQDANTVSSDKT